jgi:hypothetical protein
MILLCIFIFQERIKDHGGDHQGDKKDKVQAGRDKIIGGNFGNGLGKKRIEGGRFAGGEEASGWRG